MNTALLVIDVQNAFFRPASPPADDEGVLARINALSGRARARKAPVIFIQHECAEDGMAFESSDWQLDSRLQVEPNDLKLRKTTTDSFLETPLQTMLEEAMVTRLVVCGYASEFCVDTTVRRAAALGFEVTLASDAHTTDDKPHLRGAQIREHHNLTLADLTSFRGEIRTLREDAIWSERSSLSVEAPAS